MCVVGRLFGIVGQANAGVIPKGYRCGSMPKTVLTHIEEEVGRH